MIIQQIEDLYEHCGHDCVIHSEINGLVHLPKWISDVVLIGPAKAKSVYVVCTPEAEGGQSYFAALQKCEDQLVNVVQTVRAERSILKILREDQDAGPGTKTRIATVDDQILFDTLLQDAVSRGVSDILIDNSNGRYSVKFDIDTMVYNIRGVTRTEAEAMMRHFYQNIADQDSVEDPIFSFDKAQFAAGDGIWFDQSIRIRYQSMPSFPDGCDFALRLLNLSDAKGFSTYESLKISPDQMRLLKKMNRTGSGAVITSGPTSAGKTTTIKVLIEECLEFEPGIQIRTAESPPEYIIRGARQHHVGEDVSGNTDVHAEAIKEMMRMRPDKLYIGEIRSRQTGELFSKAVLTGHGVLTTVHADSPYEVITRLESEGISRDVMASGRFISGLLYQKRLPRLCQHCKTSITQSKDRNIITRLELLKVSLDNVFFHNHEGCSKCSKTGFDGSIVCMDIIVPNKAMRECIKNRDEPGFYKEWIEHSSHSNYGNAVETSLYHAMRNMVLGEICPDIVERRYGEIDQTLLKEQTRTWTKDGGFAVGLA